MNFCRKNTFKFKNLLSDSASKLPHIEHFEIIVLSILVFSALCYFTFTNFLNGDEREHVTASFYIYSGQIPYRDFFEHHHPLLWYTFLPFMFIFNNSENVWYAARLYTLILFFINSYFLFKICLQLLSDRLYAWLSVLLSLMPHCVFLSQTEFRPDTLMMTTFLIGTYYLFSNLKNKGNNLILSFFFYTLSFFSLQKVCFQLIPIACLIIFWLYKKTISLKDFFKALILPAAMIELYVLYLWHEHSLKDYFELNWLLNLKITTHIQYPVHQTAYYIIANIIAIITLFNKSHSQIKAISFCCLFTSFILQFIFIGAFRHYWLPVYPYFAIITAYFIFSLKPFFRTLTLFAIIVSATLNYHTYYKLNQNFSPLKTFVYLSKQVLKYSSPDDLIIGGSATIGGLRKDAVGYYWFARDHVALLDYHYFKRHEFPNRDKIIRARRPKLFSTENWRTCITENYHLTFNCKLNQTTPEDQKYIDENYNNHGFIYIRKD